MFIQIKTVSLWAAAFMAAASLLSCAQKDNGQENSDPELGDGYHAIARMSVPSGIRELMVETYALDNGGHKTDINYKKVSVTPQVALPEGGKDVEPFGQVTLLLQAPKRTLASVYYTVSGIIPTKADADADRTHEPQYVVVDLPVNQPGDGLATKAPGDPVVVALPEPAEYVTVDDVQTFYHSSGVVMFEDSWPTLTGGVNDEDFNDVVIDYDVECKTVADESLETEGWREQVKVVMHVRALSGDEPHRVGMILEGFDMHNVAHVTEYKTLDSYGSGHGELPEWTKVTLQENSLHYDPLATEYATTVWDRPAIEIGRIDLYHSTSRGAGTETYLYLHDGTSTEHVMNPALKQYAAWGGAHTEQYSEEIPADLLAKSQGSKYYNVIPGYVNVAGGLYTYTVVYEMKPRFEMTQEQRDAVKKNMIDAVVNTTSQNFYIVKSDYTPVGLKGYAPVDFSVKNYSDYSAKYKQKFEANKDHLSADTYYLGSNGEVWGFKCPTLTKHVWNKMSFGKAYPHYLEWIQSNGEAYPDWYVNGVDGKYLTCWW